MSLRTRLAIGTLIPLFAAAVSASAQTPGSTPQDPYGRGRSQPTASLKVEVTPRQTQVFIDGYYAGIADDFDGAFQELRIEAGEHDIQLFLPGYRLRTEHVTLQPEATTRLRQTMERLAAGEPEPRRPTAAPRPPRAFAPRPEQAPAAGGDYGSLSIRVQPSEAELLIDGTAWVSPADAPLVVQLAPGSHTVEVKKGGYRTYLTEITVRGGEATLLNISLSRMP